MTPPTHTLPLITTLSATTMPSSIHSSAQSSPYSISKHTPSESLLFTPPLSPTEEQLLAFLIPDIEPSELAAYLSAPATPVLSDVSCLIGKSLSLSDHSDDYTLTAVYPSPVCAAAAATVVAMDRLDCALYPSMVEATVSLEKSESMLYRSKKRSSSYAFMGDDEDEHEAEFDYQSPVFVMSSRDTRKRLMLEQAFVSPDEDVPAPGDCYAQLFCGASSAVEDLSLVRDSTSELSHTMAFDLVLS